MKMSLAKGSIVITAVVLILLIGKLADATFPNLKRTRHRKQIAITSDCYAQWPMEYSTDEE